VIASGEIARYDPMAVRSQRIVQKALRQRISERARSQRSSPSCLPCPPCLLPALFSWLSCRS